MERSFEVDGNTLVGHLAGPPRRSSSMQCGILLAHGFPTETGGGINSWKSFPELADRIAAEAGWVAFTFPYRGVQAGTGNFSLNGWRRDVMAGVQVLLDEGVDKVWVAGFGTGGALVLSAAADMPEIAGVAAIAAPADFEDWAKSPRKLLVHARGVGVIHDPDFPRDFDAWAAELRSIRTVDAAEKLAPRPLLVLHGSNDDQVPSFDARAVADAHGAADLRIISGAVHHLRHDPRAVAVFLGWLDRQRAQLAALPE